MNINDEKRIQENLNYFENNIKQNKKKMNF